MSRRDRLLSQTLLLGAALTTGFAVATPALAQDDDVIVVTGSRIPQPNLETTSPVTQVTGDDVQTQGVTRVEDLVNQLPQAFAAQNSTVSNGASGIASIDLRNIGEDRTLVLVDGRRMPYGSPNDSAADINMIPGALIERVEILTGGAGAIYGSDAVAGVVNFIMMDDFEGVRLDAQYGFYQHGNDYDNGDTFGLVQNIRTRNTTNPSQFALPDENVVDGYSKEITAIMGVNTDDGRGNITAYLGYRNNDAVTQANRDYSACSIQSPAIVYPSPANGFVCGGSSTNATGRFTDPAFTVSRTVDVSQTQAFRPFSGSLDQYNFGPTNFYQRPDERYTAGVFGRYEINEHAEAYAQFMFQDYSSVAQIAPSGIFFGSGPGASGGYVIDCANPLATSAQLATFGCSGSTGNTEILIGRRNVEGGPRQDDLNYTTYRGVAGVRGELVEGWNYDVYAQYSRVSLNRTYLNEFSKTRAARALDVVIDPATGQAACRAAIDPDGPLGPLAAADAACVPYNLWRPGGITQAALDYIQVAGVQTGDTSQQVVSATVTGDLGELGLQSPAASRPIQTAFGIEYRRDTLSGSPDTSFQTDDLYGQGGATLPVSGDTDVLDIFVEFDVPLVTDQPFAEEISADLSYRYSDYSGGFSTDTYGIGLDWAPTSAVRARASFQRSVRAPNVLELFTPEGNALFDADEDPCGPAGAALTGAALATRQTRCAATGAGPGVFGNAALDSPAGQYNFLTAGNPNLQPEEADTTTFGIVFSPDLFDGFNLSIDYWKIELANRIDIIDPNVTLSQCYDQGVTAACNRITRSSIGTIWTSGGFIEARNTNIGGLETSGIDVNSNLAFELPSGLGGADINFIGTYIDDYTVDPGVGASEIFQCVGVYNSNNECALPTPEWRHRARLGWDTPWNLSLALTWRYYGSVELDGRNPAAPRVDDEFDAQNYFDVAGTYDLLSNATLRFGVNNVLDRSPPLSASVGTTGNGNTYPQLYDAMGRYVFAGVTVDF